MLLFRRHRAAENRIAMRESPEAPDDIAMAFRMLGMVLAKSSRQRNTAILIGDVFGVAQRKINEDT